MRLQLCLVAVATVFLFSLFTSASGYNLVCYFSSWAIYRNLSGKFDVSDIDANLCTHINFAFIELFEDGSLYVVDPWESNDDDEGGHYHGFSNLKKLKETNPSLKILLSLGGWNEGSKNFSIVAADATKRQKLAWECLNLIEKYSFDGLDIDWEYPTLRADSHPEDKENFIAMLKDFYDIMKPKGLMLTAALAGAVDKIEAAYDVEQIQLYLDMLNIMTYDYHGAFDNFVGHISPLHPSKPDYEHGHNSTYTVATGLQYWLYKNADPTKLNMGIPTYARVFTLADKENTELYAPIAGPGEKGLFTGLAGTLSYQEICALTSDSTCYWDDEQMVPHCVWDDQWAGFDNERSIEKKIDFAMSQNIAGIMVWSLDTDDFNGYCSNDKYPLVNTIKNRLQYHEELKKKQGK